MKKLFGTDGVRGKAGVYPIVAQVAFEIGKAIISVFSNKKSQKKPHIAIGRDTRLSGEMLENALVEGVLSVGGNASILGVIPTPGVCYTTQTQKYDIGIMISASHNSYEDNGIKIFGPNAQKLSDDLEIKIEDLVLHKKTKAAHPQGQKKIFLEGIQDYKSFLIKSFGKNTLPSIKVVLDCANGATYKIAPEVFQSLGANVISLSIAPNGKNINAKCGALYPEELQKRVVQEKAHIGIAYDGDGDRVIFVDEKGNVIHGGYVLAAWSVFLNKQKKLNKNTLVSTTMCNQGIEKSLATYGIKVVRTDVGDRYVLARMLQDGYNLGGEPSGHLIYLDLLPTGDGILSSLQILKVMMSEQKSLSELVSFVQEFPQVLKSIFVKQKKDFHLIPEFDRLKKEGEKKLGKWGRLIVRYSGTENVARVMAEGEDFKTVQDVVESLVHIIHQDIGA